MGHTVMQGGPNVPIEPHSRGPESSEHRTDAAGRRPAQPGWFIHSWAGDRIGTVVEATSDALLLRLNSIDAREVRVPTSLVSSVDAAHQRATLSVDASELDGVDLQTGRIDLAEGST